ncbi:phenylalanine--tRNA ligase subunit alpha [Brevundimonas sp. 2R-24]|uniref:Phenylalanine--tRNA ligase alpha subunit n=1 Tax=Peiella sedimenti TaxID=3061083 RepID=A0ABT8SHE0_9CAUL|nr:phenylalanine--tRNA ligase subunit alpha [Caulobacteraceae bacterium XZ-24]
MTTDLENLELELIQSIGAAETAARLEELRVAALGKSGSISGLLKGLGAMTPDERREQGPRINGLRDRVSAALSTRKAELEAAELEARLASERVDLTLPAPPRHKGGLHPTMQAMDELIEIFAEMGFSVAEGPDIEDDWHNFTALNFPPRHPAREMHDTFFLKAAEGEERKVLRTHTSPVQVRVMQSQQPPIRIVAPGRTYRCDSDATHTPMFHQIEGLVIDRGIHMGHLKWTVAQAVARFFEVEDVETRFRPHHFPFTEPSAEMDVRCDRSGGEIRIGQGDDWLEILGCGMVHPKVLANCGIDPVEYQGFAFGMGVDRLAMLKYGMPDLRDMFAGDVRWLSHYAFSPLSAPSAAAGLS